MLTKEQIINLCEEAGVVSAMYGEEPICKLIDAAMKLGAEQEREEISKLFPYIYKEYFGEYIQEAIRQRN